MLNIKTINRDMESFEKKYSKLKTAYDIKENWVNKGNISVLEYKCKCGKNIKINGSNSHSTVCNFSYNSRNLFLKNKYSFFDFCQYCGKAINYNENKFMCMRDISNISFCSSKCSTEARKFIFRYENYYKKCQVCGKEFFTIQYKKTCSYACGRKLSSNKMKLKHQEWKKNGTEKIIREKIINTRRENYPNWMPKGYLVWNKNLKGIKYLEHYEKDDGSNSLYEGLKKNKGYFKKTKLEEKFEKILINLKIDYHYNFFGNHTQFDFLTNFKYFVVLVETDGDWWHRSKLKFPIKEDRKIIRLEDKLKEINLLNTIQNTEKTWVIIRFWENDINNNFEKVFNFMKSLKEENDQQKFSSILSKIKEYYQKKS